MVFQSKGFTLIELIVTVAVVAIVAAIAIPSFNDQIRNNRSVMVANEFIDAVSFARSQAASTPARVSICASSDQATCVGDWRQGYIIFVDLAATDSAVPPVMGAILKVVRPSRDDIEMNVAFGGNATGLIRFSSTGALARLSTNVLTVKTKVTNCNGNYAREIIINSAGQTTVLPRDCNITF